MSLEELQKENEQLKKEIEDLKSNIYNISVYAKGIESHLAKTKMNLRLILSWTRLDWSE